jgi:poly[(R)-3-hydroxyalkanoate] polymerase subunit PhaE
MTETGFWSSDWMETQRRYWQAWTDLSLKAMGGKAPTPGSWEGALEHWWQALAPAAPEASREVMERLLEQGKMFFRMTDDITRNLSRGTPDGDWGTAVHKTLSDLQGVLGAAGGGDEALHRIMAFWEMPFDNWQRMVSSLSLLPGDALRNMPHDQVKEGLSRFLSAPGLGYTREEQGRYQDLTRHGLDYQKALQEYLQFFSQIGLQSAEQMRIHLARLQEQGKVIDSARGLYELWVACCEETYGKQVMTPEYARLHGRLVNTLMAFKQRLTSMVDEALGAMNMPTRAELRTLQDRLQETRRDNKALRRELDAVKDLVAALGAGAGPAIAMAAEARRAPARRKAPSPKAAPKGT